MLSLMRAHVISTHFWRRTARAARKSYLALQAAAIAESSIPEDTEPARQALRALGATTTSHFVVKPAHSARRGRYEVVAE